MGLGLVVLFSFSCDAPEKKIGRHEIKSSKPIDENHIVEKSDEKVVKRQTTIKDSVVSISVELKKERIIEIPDSIVNYPEPGVYGDEYPFIQGIIDSTLIIFSPLYEYNSPNILYYELTGANGFINSIKDKKVNDYWYSSFIDKDLLKSIGDSYKNYERNDLFFKRFITSTDSSFYWLLIDNKNSIIKLYKKNRNDNVSQFLADFDCYSSLLKDIATLERLEYRFINDRLIIFNNIILRYYIYDLNDDSIGYCDKYRNLSSAKNIVGISKSQIIMSSYSDDEIYFVNHKDKVVKKYQFDIDEKYENRSYIFDHKNLKIYVSSYDYETNDLTLFSFETSE